VQSLCAANTMTAVELMTRCGHGDLEAIRKRLKCARCGRKAARLVILPANE